MRAASSKPRMLYAVRRTRKRGPTDDALPSLKRGFRRVQRTARSAMDAVLRPWNRFQSGCAHFRQVLVFWNVRVHVSRALTLSKHGLQVRQGLRRRDIHELFDHSRSRPGVPSFKILGAREPKRRSPVSLFNVRQHHQMSRQPSALAHVANEKR